MGEGEGIEGGGGGGGKGKEKGKEKGKVVECVVPHDLLISCRVRNWHIPEPRA